MGDIIKKQYIENYQIWPEWTPGNDTIAYYEFNNNLNDSSGNQRNLSVYSGTPTYGIENSGGNYIYFPNDCRTDYRSDSINYSDTTLSFWYKGTNGYKWKPMIEIRVSGFDIYGRISGNVTVEYMTNRDTPSPYTYSPGNTRHYYTITRDSNNLSSVYVDSVLVNSGYGTGSGTQTVRFRFNQFGDTDTPSNCNTGKLAKVIFEKKKRTQQEIIDYYNSTKAKYES